MKNADTSTAETGTLSRLAGIAMDGKFDGRRVSGAGIDEVGRPGAPDSVAVDGGGISGSLVPIMIVATGAVAIGMSSVAGGKTTVGVLDTWLS